MENLRDIPEKLGDRYCAAVVARVTMNLEYQIPEISKFRRKFARERVGKTLETSRLDELRKEPESLSPELRLRLLRSGGENRIHLQIMTSLPTFQHSESVGEDQENEKTGSIIYYIITVVRKYWKVTGQLCFFKYSVF